MKIGGNIKDGNHVDNSRAVLKGSHCQFINLLLTHLRLAEVKLDSRLDRLYGMFLQM